MTVTVIISLVTNVDDKTGETAVIMFKPRTAFSKHALS